MAKDPVKYWKSEDAEAIAEELIAQFHPHLAGETIVYIFRSEHTETNGKPKLGEAKRVTGLNAYLAAAASLEEMNDPVDNPAGKHEAPPLKVIELAFDTWLQLNGTQRIALVDHELMHFGPDGMRSHDVEEFRAVIDRHGLWQPDLELLAASMSQFKLFPDAPPDPAGTTSGKATMSSAAIRNVVKAAENLRPKKGSGIDSITFSSPGSEPVTLTAKD